MKPVTSIFRVEECPEQEAVLKVEAFVPVSCLACCSTLKCGHVPPRHRPTFNRLHDVITRQTEMFLTVTTRSSSPTHGLNTNTHTRAHSPSVCMTSADGAYDRLSGLCRELEPVKYLYNPYSATVTEMDCACSACGRLLLQKQRRDQTRHRWY
jgi:hypothetical protein